MNILLLCNKSPFPPSEGGPMAMNSIVTGLIDAFQDCSTFQSEDAHVGFDVLEAMNLVWVVNYWEVQIEKLPKLCDRVN